VDWKADRGKSGLIKVLVSLGFSFRRGERAVNDLFDLIAGALCRGERVEIPGGTLETRPVHQKRRPRLTWLTNIQTGKRRYPLVWYSLAQQRILFRPDRDIFFTLPPRPAPPPAPPQLPRSPDISPKRRYLDRLSMRFL
jgi:nucleoid DNA-binding protein